MEALEIQYSNSYSFVLITSGILYRPITPLDYEVVTGFIKSLYTEDPGEPMTDQKIQRTFQEFTQRPDKGMIMVFEKERKLVGYAVLVNFWSNEYGGNIVNIDELFIVKESRGQGIATGFIQHLIDTKFNNAVGLELEVTPRNLKAKALYERLGFANYKNNLMFMEIA